MQLNGTVSPTQIARINDFVDQGGDLDSLLALAHLADPEMRPLSRLAVHHSRDYSANFLPHTLIFQLSPRAKRVDERTDVRLITGKVQLGLEAGTVSGTA